MLEGSNVILEACAGSLQQAMSAQDLGADRVEICTRLDLDGLTPDRRMVKATIKKLKIPSKIMIRPRDGGFVYSDAEIKQMESSMDFCRSIGIEEVVLGALTNDGEVDINTTSRLSDLANPLKVTFHKAIDHSNDILKGIECLCHMGGVTSILTSGGKRSAMEGRSMIKQIIREFSSELNIIVAGKITKENLSRVHEEIGAKEYHGKRIVGDLTKLNR